MGRRVRFFTLEAIRSIRSNASISFAAIATVLIALTTLGIVFALFSWSQSEINAQKDKLDLKAYLRIEPPLSAEETNKAIAAVQGHPNVKSIEFKSADQVLEEYKRENGSSVIDLLAANPFPATITIKPNDPAQQTTIVDDLTALPYWLKDKTTPKGFVVREKTTSDLLSAIRVLRWGGFGLMVILVIAAILLIGNTIRLSIFARRREVEVMRLVGATNWFVRWPFVIEGLVCGLLGAIGAAAVIAALKFTIVDGVLSVSTSPLQQDGGSTIGLPALAAIVILVGAALGALGSGITLRRFLRV